MLLSDWCSVLARSKRFSARAEGAYSPPPPLQGDTSLDSVSKPRNGVDGSVLSLRV